MIITYSQQRPLLTQDFIPVPRGNVIRLKNFNYHVLQDVAKKQPTKCSFNQNIFLAKADK